MSLYPYYLVFQNEYGNNNVRQDKDSNSNSNCYTICIDANCKCTIGQRLVFIAN